MSRNRSFVGLFVVAGVVLTCCGTWSVLDRGGHVAVWLAVGVSVFAAALIVVSFAEARRRQRRRRLRSYSRDPHARHPAVRPCRAGSALGALAWPVAISRCPGSGGAARTAVAKLD